MYRVLKPGRWITVEFHNTKASVWNAIQEALSKAGFVVAQVAVLDKQQGSFKQVTAAGAVKNDLVINAYKPRRAFEERFLQQAGVGQERAFIAQHLDMLPLAANVERSREMLFSKLLAYYVQRGYEIQYDADSFYALLRAEFVEADGYWFKDESQLPAYRQNKQKQAETDTGGQQSLFVFDERSAIQWLKRFLHSNPGSLSDIQPAYLKALQTSDDQIPELQTLLAENFGSPDSQGRYRWPQPDMQEQLEKERQQRLLRLFNDYLRQAQAGKSWPTCAKKRFSPASPTPTAPNASTTSSPLVRSSTNPSSKTAPRYSTSSKSPKQRPINHEYQALSQLAGRYPATVCTQTPKTRQMILAIDPDQLMQDDSLLALLLAQNYDILPLGDEVEFRHTFERDYRQHWDQGNRRHLIVIVHAPSADNHIPYDIYEKSERIHLSVSELFPRLNAIVARELDNSYYLDLYPAHKTNLLSQSTGQQRPGTAQRTGDHRIHPAPSLASIRWPSIRCSWPDC
jgi:hypothetical protein